MLEQVEEDKGLMLQYIKFQNGQVVQVKFRTKPIPFWGLSYVNQNMQIVI